MYTAAYGRTRPDGRVACLLCPQGCVLGDGETGLCRVRVNKDGQLFTANYGQVTALALDPIEKKPLYHFHPGAAILSVGSFGCNLGCSFCQNWEISQQRRAGQLVAPEDLVELARKTQAEGNIGLAYTYAEPAVWWEFMLETAGRIRAAGLKNVMVTNGYLNPEPWEELLPYLDAVNLDVKAFTGDFYKRHCRGRLEPVLASVERLAGRVHLELTTLLIPGWNDGDDEIRTLAQWLAAIDPKIPLHLTRYYPQYQMDLPPTPPETLERAYRIAREKLDFVYIGNLATDHRHTLCPQCGALWVERSGWTGRVMGIADGRCRVCGLASPLVL
ncbi:MAG TPA: AmmeMemoRadiSam system radical SAM enzyme [Firmicutes bacterium]|jgi:pyruvate formate lyase activating enzyme|nr:AmmeMemoRadiSam system radical SAM enzyme [Bacillota bacterium]HOQ24789.1 AmmeMemoRadiSam system radical SAM enzyme [Bacillota bacterium]HPT68021.1 AmmeMemoRadiSam system radical SAM enzyme [Bacillota bacterium]